MFLTDVDVVRTNVSYLSNCEGLDVQQVDLARAGVGDCLGVIRLGQTGSFINISQDIVLHGRVVNLHLVGVGNTVFGAVELQLGAILLVVAQNTGYGGVVRTEHILRKLHPCSCTEP